MLKIDGLTYIYYTKSIPHPYHFSLEADRGEVIGILGESGSGKSTMLDLIAGFLEPDSGSILLDGEAILPLPIERRPVTILFQQHNLFEHLSVKKNILLGISPNGKSTSQVETKITQILKEMGLANQIDKLPIVLSGGQQQRVALARALLRKKPILLLDEPFSGLDRKTRLEMLSLVQTITQREGLHTIMVTHETEDCELIADRVYKMKDGTLLPINPDFLQEKA